MGVLLTLNIMATVSAIFMIVVLFLRQNRLVETEKNNEKMMRELEELFSSYMLEMKEENETFLRKVKGTMSGTEHRFNDEQEEPESKNEGNVFPPIQNTKFLSAKKAYQQTMNDPSDTNDSMDHTIDDGKNLSEGEDKEENTEEILKKVRQLQNEGASIEVIAKQLNLGKTEVELLLKFSKVDRSDT